MPSLSCNCPTALASSSDAAQAVIDTVTRHRNDGRVPPILTNWLGEAAVAEARAKFREAGIPSYESPADAIKGFGYLWQYTKRAGILDADAAARRRPFDSRYRESAFYFTRCGEAGRSTAHGA